MMGEKTSRTFAKTMNFLEEMEKRVDSDGKRAEIAREDGKDRI